jgi:hypothetical protein
MSLVAKKPAAMTSKFPISPRFEPPRCLAIYVKKHDVRAKHSITRPPKTKQTQ